MRRLRSLPLVKRLRASRILILFALAWAVYFGRFWSGAFFFDHLGNLQTTHVNLWGDWAAHFTMGSALGYRNLWLTESPFLVGQTFSYPFAANWISALLIRAGLPFLASFVIPSFVFSMATVLAIYWWYRTWLGTAKRAVVASLLLLCNGGLGFVFLLRKITDSSQPVSTLINLPHQATNIPDVGIRWLSMVDSMIIPQRAFGLGFPLALICLTLIYHWSQAKKQISDWKLVLVGTGLGLLPLAHMHSFLALGLIIGWWAVIDLIRARRSSGAIAERLRFWSVIGISAAAVALPLYFTLFAQQVGGFFRWAPGWLAPEFALPWWQFWLWNWGPTLVLFGLGVALTWRTTRTQVASPFAAWFILANLFLFQPWAWDNTKLLIWAAVGACGVATLALVRLWHTRQRWLRPVVVASFCLAILSGAIDLYWIQRRSLHTYRMYSAEEWKLAEWVRANTTTTGYWLTGAEHNHWLFNLTGRQPLMAYRGWLWTHGYNYLPSEQLVTELFASPSAHTLRAAGVSYVVIGPQEVSQWGADPQMFSRAAQLIHQTRNHTLWEVK